MPTPALPPLPPSIVAVQPLSDEDLQAIVDAFGSDVGADGRPVAEVLLDPGDAEADPLSPDGVTLRRLPEAARGFRLENIGQAEWAMRHLRDSIAAVGNAEAQAAAWHDEIDRWAAQVTAGPKGTAAWFHGLLMDWGHRSRLENDKAPTLPLPSGTVETTKRKPAPKVDDAEALLAWALEHAPDIVETPPVVQRVPAAAAKALGRVVELEVLDDDTNAPIGARLAFVTSSPAEDGSGEVVEVEVPGMVVTPGAIDVRVKPGPC